MKTFTITKTVTEIQPLLEIRIDEFANSPRENDNIGYLSIRKHRHYNFPNELGINFDEPLKNSINPEDFYIYPLDCYEHSGISFSLSGKGMQCNFDTAKNVGYICIPKEYDSNSNKEWNLSKKQGVKSYILEDDSIRDKEWALDKKQGLKRYITEDDSLITANRILSEYNAYLNGEVYEYTLYDIDGDVIDSCSGIYDIDGIKSMLPDEWADENMHDYFISN